MRESYARKLRDFMTERANERLQSQRRVAQLEEALGTVGGGMQRLSAVAHPPPSTPTDGLGPPATGGGPGGPGGLDGGSSLGFVPDWMREREVLRERMRVLDEQEQPAGGGWKGWSGCQSDRITSTHWLLATPLRWWHWRSDWTAIFNRAHVPIDIPAQIDSS